MLQRDVSIIHLGFSLNAHQEEFFLIRVNVNGMFTKAVVSLQAILDVAVN